MQSMSEEYECQECGKTFDSERGLHIHIGEVHPDKKEELISKQEQEQGSYTCDQCGKEFDSERGLHVHIGQTHPDKKEELIDEEDKTKGEKDKGQEPKTEESSFSSKKSLIAGLGVVVVLVVAAMLLLNTPGIMPSGPQGTDTSSNETATQVGDEVAATVNGENITNREVERMRQQMNLAGQNATKEEILEQLVTQEILKQEAEKKGYQVSVKEGEQRLEEKLARRNISLDELKQRVKQQGASWENQIKVYQEQFALRDYIDDKVAERVDQVTEEEIQQRYQTLKQSSQREMPPLEEIKQKLNASIQQQKRQEAINSLIKELKPQYDIVYK